MINSVIFMLLFLLLLREKYFVFNIRIIGKSRCPGGGGGAQSVKQLT